MMPKFAIHNPQSAIRNGMLLALAVASAACHYDSLAHLTLIYDAPSGQIVEEFEINGPASDQRSAVSGQRSAISSQPADEEGPSIAEILRWGWPRTN